MYPVLRLCKLPRGWVSVKVLLADAVQYGGWQYAKLSYHFPALMFTPIEQDRLLHTQDPCQTIPASGSFPLHPLRPRVHNTCPNCPSRPDRTPPFGSPLIHAAGGALRLRG